ncbi:MAG: hypothetical protein NWE89_00035 [Candidatus Bathyarchaeota archaeon]|nr:hypothetical protein [Candidatus Bathyarchaeota archaeon]
MTEKFKTDDSITKDTHIYTPGLKLKRNTIVKKDRRLPIPGEVLIKKEDIVEPEMIIAKTDIGSFPQTLQVSTMLGIKPKNLHRYMKKQVGDAVEEGELLALYTALFGLIKRPVKSPITGTVGTISDLTGQVILKRKPIPVEINAYIPGKVVEIISREGAVIETNAAFIQGIFGIGGERHGKIRIAVESPHEVLTPSLINPDDKGVILIGGSMVTTDALKKGVNLGVSCIVVGGIRHNDFTAFMGEEIGVAITGQEELGITLILTEGFGELSMSPSIFSLLCDFEGFNASVNGATQIRSGVIRPEIIIPLKEGEEQNAENEKPFGIVSGASVRIVRQPYFGKIGEVINIPIELHQLESESKVRVLDVQLANGSIVRVPRANVEIIEE